MEHVNNFDLTVLRNNIFYFLKLPVEISVFIESNKLTTNNLVCVDHRSNLPSFISQYEHFSIGEFLKTFNYDALFKHSELDFINSFFLLKDLSKIGFYCFYILESTKKGNTILIDLDGFSDSSQCLCFEFLKKMSGIFLNKTFIVVMQNAKFNLSIVNKEDKLTDFVDDINIPDEKDFIEGLYNHHND